MKIKLLIILSIAIFGIANAQYTKLFDFAGPPNGFYPRGDLYSDGTFLYGITTNGGTNNDGTLFKIKTDGTGDTVLLQFSGAANGSAANGSLISDGIFLYGMTNMGGTNNFPYGDGTIFKIKPDGTGYVKLLDFAGVANGKNPFGSLISDGNFLYGMTYYGGTNNDGVIFKIKPDGTGYIKLLDFAGATNGKWSGGSLIYDGTFLYGMTTYGGTNNSGTVFKIKPDGTGYVKLLDFAGATNGRYPDDKLYSDGTYLYGMTNYGGTNDSGTVFKIKPDGTGYVKLLDFAGATDGSGPVGSLISDGTFLYGMTTGGGTNNDGVIFKIKPDGTGYVKLLDFAGVANGTYPDGSLISDGTFMYGVTEMGGTSTSCTAQGCGVIFKINPLGMGIDENNTETNFAIFPNPFFSSTTLQTANYFRNATLTVYNSFGQTVKQIDNLAGQIIIFHRDNLQSGLYFIRITQDGKTFATEKLVITDK